MLAVAIKEAFRTALTGRCDARPDLAAERIPLAIRVPALRCRGGDTLADRVFSAARLERRRTQPAAPASRVGRLPVSRPAADRRAEAGGRAEPPVRAAARARRRQALLGVHRGGRQADPGRRRLAGRPPGQGAHHPPLPVPPAKTHQVRAGPAGRSRRHRARRARQRRHRGSRGRRAQAAGGPAPRGHPGHNPRKRRAPGRRPRLRRRRAHQRPARRPRRSSTSPRSTCPPGRCSWPPATSGSTRCPTASASG